jgi:hypothetical protein
MTPSRVALPALLAVAVLAASACAGRSAHLLEVEHATVAGYDLVEDEVRRAIIRASVERGWRIVDEREGYLVSRLDIRQHMAEVVIRYDARGYDILYRDSHNLRYDPAAHTIHRNYNRWILNLDQSIQQQLLAP